MIGVVGLGLAACSSSDGPSLADDQPNPSSSSSSSTTTTTKALTTFTIGDRVTSQRGNEVTVYSYQQPTPAQEFLEPQPGFEYAVIDVEACALVESEDADGIVFVMDPSQYVLEMPDNTRLTTSYIGATATPRLESSVMYQGDCVRGFVDFKVPIGQRPVAVRDTGAAPPLRWLVP